ncbi:MAG: O-methyltransferase [Bacteroidota bacterium]
MSSNPSEELNELYRETHLKHLIPAMISGPIQGRFLSMISKLVRPKRILEIGTYTGYSTICLAEGLSQEGLIHTIDRNEELQGTQKKFWEKTRFNEKIIAHLGNAMDIISDLNEDWDLVFIDADKNNYINYYKALVPDLKSGSVIIVDNVLWYGKVAQKADPDDLDTRGIQKLNEFINSDERVEQVLLPIRDGITIARVK